MRKLFSLCAAMLVALAANATVKNIEPGTDKLTAALSSAADGDTIILADGTYNEAGDYIVFDKNVEVKAAENAKPQIDVVNYIKVSGGKTVKIQGLKFNGEAQGSRDQYIRIYTGENNLEVVDCEFDAIKKNIFRCEAGNKFASLKVKNCKFNNSVNSVIDLESSTCGDIEFDGCEFTWGTAVPIHFEKTSHADKLSINNCYFHDGKRSAVFFEAPSPAAALCDSVFVTNSTFAKIANTNDYWVSIIDIRNGGSQTKLGYVLVDHCTFYDCTTINTDHVAVRVHKSIDATVSNCIFWDPNQDTEDADSKRAATNLYGGDVKNCIAYNYFYGTAGHIHNGATYTACSQADPLFVDAPNGDYRLGGGSPALAAATDGGAIGDPRWGTKFFVVGSAVGGWDPDKVAVPGSSYTIKDLAAGSYQLKITRNGTWEGAENVYGYDALTAKIGGLYRGYDTDEDNICFTLAAAGDVKVTYIHGEKYTVEGDFVMPTVKLMGSLTGGWTEATDAVVLEPAENKLTASAKLHLNSNYYEFKVLLNGAWLSKAGSGDLYTLWREWTSVSGLEDVAANIKITPDVEGDYTFTWTYGEGKLDVEFPAEPVSQYYIAGSFTDWGDEKLLMSETDGVWSISKNFLGTETGQEFQVVFVKGLNTAWYGLESTASMTSTNCTDWVIGGGNKNIGLELKGAGNYLFKFVPEGMKLSVVYPTATAIDGAEAAVKAQKMIENGQLFIIKNGNTYNAQGQLVK